MWTSASGRHAWERAAVDEVEGMARFVMKAVAHLRLSECGTAAKRTSCVGIQRSHSDLPTWTNSPKRPKFANIVSGPLAAN